MWLLCVLENSNSGLSIQTWAFHLTDGSKSHLCKYPHTEDILCLGSGQCHGQKAAWAQDNQLGHSFLISDLKS